MLWTNFLSTFVVARPYAFRKQFSKFSTAAIEVNYSVPFLFPGQGAQFVGMAKNLCEQHNSAKRLFDNASALLGYDLLDVCINGPKTSLDLTVISQPAIFVSSMAALEKLRASNASAYDSCTVAMGLSLGEYSAFCFAGAFSFEDGVKLTKARGEAMQVASNAVSSGMVAAIGLTREKAQELCDAASLQCGHALVIGNFLCNGNYVLSGHHEACKAARGLAKAYKARIVPLAVSGAFHSSFMESAVPLLKTALDKVEIFAPRLPVLANADSLPKTNVEEIRAALLRQVVNPVLWEDIMIKALSSPHFKTCFEIGPGTVCRGIVHKINPIATVHNIF